MAPSHTPPRRPRQAAGADRGGTVQAGRARRRGRGVNWENKTLFVGDNVHVMRGMNSDSVDLIYADPPSTAKSSGGVLQMR
ncbi:MAG: hypothetical protein F4X17_16410 [Gemmatimonadetes bacterium]|nr:hypothetical protein [Gemmatimonadota bacterium]